MNGSIAYYGLGAVVCPTFSLRLLSSGEEPGDTKLLSMPSNPTIYFLSEEMTRPIAFRAGPFESIGQLLASPGPANQPFAFIGVCLIFCLIFYTWHLTFA